MKIAVPLPAPGWSTTVRAADFRTLVALAVAILVPVLLIAEQPISHCGRAPEASRVSGLQFRYILDRRVDRGCVPVVWHFLHDYQRQRVLTFLNPQTDPLGAGYHTIQSQIAIGSGGLFGKGYMNGSQAQLEFLPERSTDFIFAVVGEEWGLVGLLVMLILYLFVIARGLYIAAQAQDTFSRLIAGSLTLTFCVYVFVNSGMVAGLLPVVGVPLPLGELWRNVDGDPHGRLRYPHVRPLPSQTGCNVTRNCPLHRMPRSPLFVFLASLGALTGSPANALDGQREDVTSFANE
jgi:rod shape determining protein RodA